jgi:hypothetical protein
MLTEMESASQERTLRRVMTAKTRPLTKTAPSRSWPADAHGRQAEGDNDSLLYSPLDPGDEPRS